MSGCLKLESSIPLQRGVNKACTAKQEEKSNGQAKPQPRVPQPKARVVPPPPTKPRDDYLGDVDLPSSSESESEEEGERHKPLYTTEEKDRTFNSMVCDSLKGPSAALSTLTCSSIHAQLSG